MRNFSSLSKIVILTVFFITACAFEVTAATTPSSPSSTSTQRRAQTPREKRQQLEQESSTARTAVESAYRDILSYVNSAQSPSKEDLETALKAVARNRKYLLVFDNLEKSTYHILSAWVYYFDEKQDKAMKEAASGQKAAPTNFNTLKTRLAISMIYKDYTSTAETLTEQNAETRPARPTGNTESQPQSYQRAGDDIRLDVNALKIESLGRVFDLHPEPAEANSTYSWRSAGRLTCTFLWKIDANELDRFAPAKPKSAAEANEPNKPRTNTNPESQFAQREEFGQRPRASKLDEFSQLQKMFEKDERTVFAAINLNPPEKRKNLENWLGKNPHTWKTFLCSAEEQEKITSLIGDSNSPKLLIVGPNSTVRYVGDVNGFLPQMIIQNIQQNPLEFTSADYNEPNQPPAASLAESPAVSESNEPNLPAVESAQPAESPVEPNITPVLTVDTNKTDTNKPKPQASAPVTQNVDDGFSAATDYEAEKLLSNARTFLQIGNRLPSHEYRNPIEWCRKVMKDYPNTKYAQEAQMLLRNVPKEYREQYKITDEELGL